MPKRPKRNITDASPLKQKRRKGRKSTRPPKPPTTGASNEVRTPSKPAIAGTSSNKLSSRRKTPQGNIVRQLERRQRSVLKNAQRTMRTKGYTPSISSAPNEPLNDTAIALLEGLGCTILSQQIYTQDYSLISDQTDTEMIENTNIIDHKLFDKLSPALMNAGKNFKNFNDPIFKLDQPLPRAQTKMRDKAKTKLTTPNVEMLTADLINLNIKTNGAGKLKNFK